MNSGSLDSLTLDGVPVTGGKKTTYTTDAKLVLVGTKTYTTDAILQKNQSKTYTTDALLQGGSTKFYSSDALLITPYHDYGTTGRLVEATRTQPTDPKRVSTWTQYNRPSVPVDRQTGVNSITGKIEYYDAKSGLWKNYDGTNA